MHLCANASTRSFFICTDLIYEKKYMNKYFCMRLMYPINVLPTSTDSWRNQNFFLLLITDILLPLSSYYELSVPAYIFCSFSIIITLFLSSLLIFHCLNDHGCYLWSERKHVSFSNSSWSVLDCKVRECVKYLLVTATYI